MNEYNFKIKNYCLAKQWLKLLILYPSIYTQTPDLLAIELATRNVVETYSSHYTILSDLDVTSKSSTTPAHGSVLTINQPGKYSINKSLVFSPQNNHVTGILIDSNHVILDLKNYALTQNNSTSNFSCITIAPGHSNITISNGTLADCTGIALNISNGTKLVLENLTINHSQATGLQLINCNNSLITGIYVTNSTTANSPELVGISLTNCTNLKITESASNNHTNNTANGIVYGFQLHHCNNCAISNCNSNNHQADRANGYFLTSASNCILRNCKANNNLATLVIDDQGVTGFNLLDSRNCRLLHCQANANQAKGDAYGFKLWNCQFNKLFNCDASFNQTSCNASHTCHAYGFYCNHDDGQIGGNNLHKCRAIGNLGGNHLSSMGVGFALDSGAKQTSICNSTAEYNHGPVGLGCGIYLNGAVACVIQNNRIVDNTGNASVGGYGIYDTKANSTNLYCQNWAYGNGTVNGSTVNNYQVTFAPNNTGKFPVITAYLNDFTNLSLAKTGNYYNIEIVPKA